jgi:hypothetical protein
MRDSGTIPAQTAAIVAKISCFNQVRQIAALNLAYSRD